MWRPGKLQFLIGVKNPLPIRPAGTARKHGPLRGRADRQIRDSSRATPSFRHASGDTSHPDRRAFLIPSVAQHTRIALAFEAGRDGFWLARWLEARGVEAHVIHPSSVAVSREHRRAKTDRLDTEC
jgi:hypothetical protein